MATMEENHQKSYKTIRNDARLLSEEIVAASKDNDAEIAADASKRLRIVTMDLIELSEEINKIYTSTLDYAEAVGMVDVEALKRDPS